MRPPRGTRSIPADPSTTIDRQMSIWTSKSLKRSLFHTFDMGIGERYRRQRCIHVLLPRYILLTSFAGYTRTQLKRMQMGKRDPLGAENASMYAMR